MIDEVPQSNYHLHDLVTVLNDSFDSEKFTSLTSAISFFKLNRRLNYKEIDENISPTFYAKIKRGLKS